MTDKITTDKITPQLLRRLVEKAKRTKIKCDYCEREFTSETMRGGVIIFSNITYRVCESCFCSAGEKEWDGT